VDVKQFTYRNAPAHYALIRYRVGSAAILKAALFSTWSFENSDCSAKRLFLNNSLACCAPSARIMLKELSDCVGARK
jgi:hypothetical protein